MSRVATAFGVAQTVVRIMRAKHKDPADSTDRHLDQGAVNKQTHHQKNKAYGSENKGVRRAVLAIAVHNGDGGKGDQGDKESLHPHIMVGKRREGGHQGN